MISHVRSIISPMDFACVCARAFGGGSPANELTKTSQPNRARHGLARRPGHVFSVVYSYLSLEGCLLRIVLSGHAREWPD